MREGSAPNFCPPTEEGVTLVLEDETGEQTELEFLGLISVSYTHLTLPTTSRV